ncbi:MAG: transporter [Bacteroidota bacterium]
MKWFLIFITTVFFMFPELTFGQCCSAGNPAGGDGSNDGLNKNELRIFTSFKHSLSTDYFHLDSKEEIPYIEKSYFDYSNLSLSYGLSQRFTLHSELGFFYNKTQELKINNQDEMIKSQGLGDLSFYMRYVALKTVKPVSQLVFSAGTRLPVGAFNEQIDGVTIPISLQPSSGALKLNASVFYSRKSPEKKFGWNSFALFEWSQEIDKGFLIYKYGHYLQLSVAGLYAITKDLNIITNAKVELRGKDTRELEQEVESSGGAVVFINPQVSYCLKKRWGIIAMADIPLYKYVNGYQLTNRFSFQFGVRKTLSLSKAKTENK